MLIFIFKTKRRKNTVTDDEKDLPYPQKKLRTQKQAKFQAGRAKSYTPSINEAFIK